MITRFRVGFRPRKHAIQEISNTEDKEHAARAVRDFERAYQAQYPKVVKRPARTAHPPASAPTHGASMPFMTAWVVKILRKPCGAKCSGLPVAPVNPVVASASRRRERMPQTGIDPSSSPILRSNSRVMGGFQTFS